MLGDYSEFENICKVLVCNELVKCLFGICLMMFQHVSHSSCARHLLKSIPNCCRTSIWDFSFSAGPDFDIHTHVASADTHLRVPVLTVSANPLSGKSSSGCTPAAQRVWNQHQWAAGGHCKPVFPLNGSFMKTVQCSDGHWTTGIFR